MIDLKEARAQLFADLGYKPLNKFWAKVEIFLGLLALGLGIWYKLHEVQPGLDWLKSGIPISFGLLLFILGGYLTLAGHRSHLYQSENERTAYLLHQIRQLKR